MPGRTSAGARRLTAFARTTRGGATLAALAVAGAVVSVAFGFPHRLLEAVLIAVVLAYVGDKVHLRATLRGLDPLPRVVLSALLPLFLLGQLLFNTRSFPFVAWQMYGASPPPGDPVVYTYVGVTRSDREVPVVLSRVLSGIAANRFSSGLEIRAEEMRTGAPDPGGTIRREYDDIIRAVLGQYNASDGADRLVAMEVFSTAIPLRPRSGGLPPVRVLRWRIGV